MSTTEVEAIRELATYGALGVVIVTAAAVSLAPAIITLGGSRPSETSWVAGARGLAAPLSRFAVRHRAGIVASWVAATVIVGVGAFSLRVETNIIEWFSDSDPIRSAYESVREHFSGITPVSIVIRSEDGRSVLEPEVLRAIDQATRDLESLGAVGRAISVTQPLRMTRRAFGDEGLPDSREEAEQYLLILEGEPQLGDVITADRRATNILLRLDSNDSTEIVGMEAWVRDWWEARGVDGYEARTTGVMFEFARAQEAIAKGQIRGLVIAVLAVAVVLSIALRSVKNAAIAMVPNALPIALAFGAMGLLGVPIDSATVCLGSLALGIAVDDTIHVMLQVDGAAEKESEPEARIERGLRPILPALTLTTICIAVGFAALCVSDFVLIRHLGAVTAVVVALCWAADVTLLPALLARPARVTT
jgi:predicted RND superfamily exporter protein